MFESQILMYIVGTVILYLGLWLAWYADQNISPEEERMNMGSTFEERRMIDFTKWLCK